MGTPPTPDGLLDEHQLSTLTGISLTTLRRWRMEKKGLGPDYVKLGKSVRYTPEAIAEWFEKNRAAS